MVLMLGVGPIARVVRLSGLCIVVGRQASEVSMQASRFFPLVKIASVLVLLLMLAGAGYAVVISMLHWSGIGV
jgi:hypothetical protein